MWRAARCKTSSSSAEVHLPNQPIHSCHHPPATPSAFKTRHNLRDAVVFTRLDTAATMDGQMQLITLGQDSSVANGSCCSSQLVQDICQRLLHPSLPLSGAAARKLQQQPSSGNALVPPEGVLLRSLPVELLYDDAGLDLFDQITQLSEYYLTAAEADILAGSGHDIVQSCVAQERALLVELGAGSMRKTRLLLDAVLAAGRQDVTFCALDLCQQSLSNALQALQGVYQGSIQLVGLVGTYQEGLAYLQQQQAHHNTQFPDSHQAKQEALTYKTATAVVDTDTGISSSDSCASICTGTSWEEPLTSQLPAMHNLLLSGTSDGVSSAAAPGSSNRSSSSNLPDAAASAALIHHGLGSSSMSSSDWCVDFSTNTPASPPAGEALCEAPAAAALRHTIKPARAVVLPRAVASNSSPGGKVIMWLGSSIGNSTRDDGAALLRQLKEAAMQPGDALLVGIDRRNSPAMVEAAYNDTTGVTRSFILNGLTHCKRLLDGQLAAHLTTGSTGSSSSSSSMDPSAFSYFCLYNEELGRHEAYYQALKDTSIALPAAAAAPAVTLSGISAGDTACGSGETKLAGSSKLSALPPVVVPIAAGELVHVEYSHKYSRQEVGELAAAAGLVWVKAWSDSRQQYDLHMFTC